MHLPISKHIPQLTAESANLATCIQSEPSDVIPNINKDLHMCTVARLHCAPRESVYLLVRVT